MDTVFLSAKGKSFVKKKYSRKVVAQIVRHAETLQKKGLIIVSIDSQPLIIQRAR